MTTLLPVELGVLGPLQVRQDGAPVMIPGAKPRAILTMLGLHRGSVVSAGTLVELLWGDDPPRTADKALQTHISSLRRTLGEGVVVTEGAGWALRGAEIDASRCKLAAKRGRDAADTSGAAVAFEEALALWRGFPELPDTRRGLSEKTRWIESHAALVEDRADALLATGRAAEIIGELEAAVTDAPLRERRWGQLMLALYRAGRQGEALGAYKRARSLLADELGVDPGPDLRRLETAIVTQDAGLDMPVAQEVPAVTRTVTFLLTDIEGSTAAWEAQADAMAVALARHDELVEHVVTSRGGRLIKTRGEGDATFSVFERPSAAAAAAIELQDAIGHEPWPIAEPMRIRIALHTGEAELRDGDYFGRAVNRAARLRSLAAGAQILCSGATAELVIDSLPDDVVLADLGMRQLRNLARPEHVFELRLMAEEAVQEAEAESPIERPALPAVVTGAGPFVGRGQELQTLLSAWQTALVGGTRAALIAGEPGVGKTRLAGEWSRQAYEEGAVVLYGRCDEDLGAPYQPFAEALRALVPSLGAARLRGMRGVEALLALVPGLTDVMPDLAAPTRADPDTERYALFDAVVALLEVASSNAPVVLVLDDLHWAAKPTLLLLRHLLRFGEHARVQIVGTYRSTDLDRAHPLAAMLADLHRDGTAIRISLGGLDEDDVTAYVAEAGYDDEELGRALATVTGGNPFFLIEALRHVDESGGRWDESTLPQGVREAVSRRLTRLPAETNKALAAAAVVGSRFGVELVERVVGEELVDALDEASKAGIVIEEPGGYYRFNHAIVRQSLLTELPSVRRMRLHQRIAATLEAEPGADDELLAELAYHYFECAWAGNAAKAVEYCRRAADQAMARLGYEGAADLYDRALHALEELDEELPDRDDQAAELLIARCEALLAAGDVGTAEGAVSQLQAATVASPRLAAWATCFEGQLSMLIHPERLDEVEAAVREAAEKLAGLDDAAGEAMAHTVRAACLARLGRVGDCEIALDQALTAARHARDHRRVNAVLAGAPLAALWGPNPVPRAGGRCLDVVRLLRITTDSPAVEATSTRCQAVLEAFRGRAAAARRMIDSARRTVTELGLRHAVLEVEQFAGIVELVIDDPAAAEEHLRKAYNGFRRMGLDADTAEAAALLARVCLALDRDVEADELCTESERLAGHALKASIAWRTVRAQLLARQAEHREARRVAEEAVGLAERTDGLVDHGDACLALATVLHAAGDVAAARAAAERAAGLYEQKGAAALVDKARGVLDAERPGAPAPSEAPALEPDNACVRLVRQALAAYDSKAWREVDKMYAPNVSVESRRKVVGFTQADISSGDWPRVARHLRDGWAWHRMAVIAIRGERLALTRLELGTDDVSPGAPHEEMLQLNGLDEDGQFALQVFFDAEDMDAAIAELDAAHGRFEAEQPRSVELDNACVRVCKQFAAAAERKAWDQVEQLLAPRVAIESRRKIVGFTRIDVPSHEWPHEIGRYIELGMVRHRPMFVAVRGERIALFRLRISTEDSGVGSPQDERLQLVGLDEDGRIALQVGFDIEDMDAAMAELDALHARFEAEHPRSPLENAATRIHDRIHELYVSSRWDELGTLFADDIWVEDRRRGLRRESNDRATEVASIRAIADWSIVNAGATPIALRGNHLCLRKYRFQERDAQTDAFVTEVLVITEVDADARVAAFIAFDPDDLDAAFAELEARYQAGEAADYSHTWSLAMDGYAALNRHELPATTPDWVNIDHRPVVAVETGTLGPSLRAIWDLAPQAIIHVEAVHRLTGLGAVVTHAVQATSGEGLDAEWRDVSILTFDGDKINRCEVFDEAQLDDAIAKFDQLGRPAPRLENTASRVDERFAVHFAARDWEAMADLMAAAIAIDDRRHVVNAGLRHGRDAEIANMVARADIGVEKITSTVIATRAERLALTRTRFSIREQLYGEFHNEALCIIEIDTDERIVARVGFDIDDMDAAFEELDARYLAGEAAPYAHAWSLIAENFVGCNRGEIPTAAQDSKVFDHRHAASMAPGEGMAYFRASWELAADLHVHIEAVHRLSGRGAVFTHVGKGTSRDGFEAEWRTVDLMTVDGEMISRTELFDEADLDDALAMFDQLIQPAPQLENTATQVSQRFWSFFPARDWDSMAPILAADFSLDDRRQAVNAGIRQGRDAEIENLKVIGDLGAGNLKSTTVATRGNRLALRRVQFVEEGQDPEGFLTELLGIVEINSDNQLCVHVVFDPDDLDAALEELDARYLAGEAALYAHTWSLTAAIYANFNRHEITATTPDWVNIVHHRAVAFAPGEMISYVRSAWDVVPNGKIYIETAHRLTELGAVLSLRGCGDSSGGFAAEWGEIHLLAFDGDKVCRCEVFDETDIEAATARFDELSRPAPRLENTASQVAERFLERFDAREWDAMARMLNSDVSNDDRRHGINGGLQIGRDLYIGGFRTAAELGATQTLNAIATRGDRLVLTRARFARSDGQPEEFGLDLLHVIEADADNRIAATVTFEPEDIDAAFGELDARYLAGEAADYAHTWSVITRAYARLNRGELPETTQDWVNADHRRVNKVASGNATADLNAAVELAPNLNMYIEKVHRLNTLGAVFSYVATGTSQEGFEGEWRAVNLMTVDGELVSRGEIFDEADLDDVLVRFEQLHPPVPRLENAASQVLERYMTHFAARDWDIMTETLADDFLTDDRRRVVNAGVRHGRDAEIANMRSYAEIGIVNIASTAIATRGNRLVLCRHYPSLRDWPEASGDVIGVVEINTDNHISAHIMFDADDIDAALEELDARYLAGKAAEHAHTWSVIAPTYGAVSRGVVPPMTPNCVAIDHRRAAAFPPGELGAYIRAGSDLQDVLLYAEVVHRLDDRGAVCTFASQGVSREGFDAEWRGVALTIIDGDKISRTEMFDEANLDAALARFEQLSRPVPGLQNTASQVLERYMAHFMARDWNALGEVVAEDIIVDDRRGVVNAGIRQGHEAEISDLRAVVDAGLTQMAHTVIATRGGRLVLARLNAGDTKGFRNEAFVVVAINTESQIMTIVVFDPDNFDAAFAELDARYLAGEAAEHAHTWSVITDCFAALSRHEIPPVTGDLMDIDHRRGAAFAPGQLMRYLHAGKEVNRSTRTYAEVVHRLNSRGAVVTHAADLTSREDFEAEWRSIDILTIEGDRINRVEIFDETDLHTALATFDELTRPAPRLENTASQVSDRFLTFFASRNWTAMAEMTSSDFSSDDRRPVVGAGVQRGGDTDIDNMKAWASVGITNMISDVIAIRGERLFLGRTRWSGDDRRPEAFHSEVLGIIEIDSENRIRARVVFDSDDADAALEELDSRYLAGEAAAYAHTWSVIAGAYAAVNRLELPPMTPDCVNIDHRGETAFGIEELVAYLRAGPDVGQNTTTYIEAVHQLTDLGAVITYVARETSKQGFDAEWRGITVLTVKGQLISRCEVFADSELEAALAVFEQVKRPAPRLHNMASRLAERFNAYYAAGDWDAMSELMTDDYSVDDRRRVVGAGMRSGGDTNIGDLRVVADMGMTFIASTVIAIRGEHLVLMRSSLSGRDQGAEPYRTETLIVGEMDANERCAATVMFDPDDIGAAFEELERRYLAGDAAPYARTYSVIASALASFNQGQLTSPDLVAVDHRRVARFAPGDMTAAIPTVWESTPELTTRIEAVHRLTGLGAVVTYASYGSTHEGFDAAWRGIYILTVAGDRLDRFELFDEDQLEAALARFEELSRPTPRLENGASRVYEHFLAHFATRDWDAIAQLLADDSSTDDRRRVVNAGMQRGRNRNVANMRALADLGVNELRPEVIAIRGERLALTRVHSSAFQTAVLNLVEIDAEARITAVIGLDVDDIDAAFEELDARYLAGEAEPYAHTWSVVVAAFAALNRHELPPTLSDCVIVDHHLQHATVEASGLTEYMNASWELTPDVRMYIETVHRLSDLGAVITLAVEGTSREGFDAAWRIIEVLTIEGGLGKRCEVFGEKDLDSALARFDELRPPARRLENAASRVDERIHAYFAARDWTGIIEILAEDYVSQDRRRAVNVGTRHGRDVAIAQMRASADLGMTFTSSDVIATRGERLALRGIRWGGGDQRPEAFHSEVLAVVEVDDDRRIVARVMFETTDIGAAFEELDARYLAGEAAARGNTWSVIAGIYAGFNRHQRPATTPDFAMIDHRAVVTIEPTDLDASIRAVWDLTPGIQIYMEAVHRVSDLGVVVTHVAQGTSQDGLDAEWRMIDIFTIEGELVSRCEMFDEADLDAALVRFDELQLSERRPENAASRVDARVWSCYAARDWVALAETMADDIVTEDRRRVVNAGTIRGRDVEIASLQATVDAGVESMTSTVIATRGQCIAMTRVHSSYRGLRGPDVLSVVEIDDDNRITAGVLFDTDDMEAAFEELDARYVAGEAAAHEHTWSVIAQTYAALNRHELPPTAPDWVNVDHRRVTNTAAGGLILSLRATWELMPDFAIHIEAVHRLTDSRATFTYAAQGTSQEGVEGEWRELAVVSVVGGLINHCELFDEADIDAALARFDELNPLARRLENAASLAYDRFNGYLAAGNWDAMAEIVADDIYDDDRRRVVRGGIRRGRDAATANWRAVVDVGVKNFESAVIATRGQRLALARTRVSGGKQPEAFGLDLLTIIELNADNRIAAGVSFDADDIDAAIAELDARYLAGEAAAHAQVWSLIADGVAAHNRREPMPMTPDSLMIDHRLRATNTPVELGEYVSATSELMPELSSDIETVHRLSNLGAVVTQAVRGISQEGFEAEWRAITVMTVQGSLINRAELFDEADLDAALATFDELQPADPQLENTASHVVERFYASFAARDWAAVTNALATDSCIDDRRKVVGAGIRRGRERSLADLRAAADVGTTSITSKIIATRGERLILARVHLSAGPKQPDAFYVEALRVVEINADNRITAVVLFDSDELDAAFEELDTRYLAGEAAGQTQTWSVITRTYAAFNQHELPATDWVTVDHRRGTPFAPSDLVPAIRAFWDLTPEFSIQIDVVHRLSSFGAVITNTSHGTSPDGVDAEWRMIHLLTVEGDRVDRCELFDQGDLDAALARFEELQPQAPKLENAASRVGERFIARFAARDWDGLADTMSEDFSHQDRRRVVGSGVRRGQDATVADMQAIADIWLTTVASTVIATRGEHLYLHSVRFTARDQPSDAFQSEVLIVGEATADNRLAAGVIFDLDDIDAAFEELDARYLAGEAAAHAQLWSVITQNYAALNRREIPSETSEWTTIDHRVRETFEAGDLRAYIQSGWDVAPDVKMYIEAVHRLSDRAAVVTHVAQGSSREGLNVEWRMIELLAVGDVINHCELFNETDLDTALSRFDELNRQVPRLENAATRAWATAADAINRRDLNAFAAADAHYEDRRKGLRHESPVRTELMRAVFEMAAGWKLETKPVAVRGDNLALTRDIYRDTTDPGRPITLEHLTLTEVERAVILFDRDDIEGAFAELTTRWIGSGEVAHPDIIEAVQCLNVIAARHDWDAYTALTEGAIYVNHRQLPAGGDTFADHMSSVRTMSSLIPDFRVDIAEVLAHSATGVAGDVALRGTSTDGGAIEIPLVLLVFFDGDRVTRVEAFDSDQREEALARFDELNHQAPELENAATRTWASAVDALNRRDVDAFLAFAGASARYEDRRKVLSDEGPSRQEVVLALLEMTAGWKLKTEAVAVRGSHLGLTRDRYRDATDAQRPITLELLTLTELGDDGLGHTLILFDPDDINGAMAELTARWIASGEVAHPDVIETARRHIDATNRHDWDALANAYADATYVNRRQLPSGGDTIADHMTSTQAMAALIPDLRVELAEILTHSASGVVGYVVVKGTSTDGVAVELPAVLVTLFDGERMTHVELFDADQRGEALARFAEF